MENIQYYLVVFALLASFGCKPRVEEPLPAENAPSVQETANFTPVAAPCRIDALESCGAKIAKNDDGSVKSLDLTQVAADKLAAGIDTANGELNALRVVRGKGELSEPLAQSLAQSPKLTELLWTEAVCSDKALQTLSPLAELKKLRLSGLKTGGDTASILASFPAVADLDLSASTLTDADCEKIAQMPKLVKLNLYQAPIGGEGLKNLLPLAQRLVSLNLDATKIDDTALGALEAFSNLTFLHLGRTAITDSAAESLAKLSKLEKLHVTRTQMTDEGIAALKEKLPDTEIISVAE